MADSAAFHQLDERIQRYLWAEQWESLRDAQEAAIPLIVNGDTDAIVAAATAAGKTEAAFLPALTHLLQCEAPKLIVYISPLKALINDQFGRLQCLCEQLEIPVWPWHGDVSASTKKRFLERPTGVLLITPESLEALLCNRGTSLRAIFDGLAFIVVDELHAFIGSERGKQLQSLMHRVERVTGRSVPRVGLSATLGNMALAAEFLRPGRGAGVKIVNSRSEGAELKVLVKAFEEPLLVRTKDDETRLDDDEDDEQIAPGAIASHLFNGLRGSNNLIFPNSRREVERFTHLLNGLCEANHVPNEFWPHHGSLSKEIRAETEEALKQREKPATAVCTNTLELGIDIGAVKSVAQIGPPPSVASLRQRLGRSGRRKGEPAILRGYCVENAISAKSSLSTQLRLDTVQMSAMISLLIEGWFEPPVTHGVHYSTLIQQVLSHIAQVGGSTAGQLYALLCGPGAPFEGISKQDYLDLIRTMGQHDLLIQESSGLLLHGQLGEKFVNHYAFYAAFATDEEYRIVVGAKILGTLPVSQMLCAGQRILFAGKTWTVESIDDDTKTIYVVRARGGVPPLFNGSGGWTHTRVRRRMRELLESDQLPAFLDETAKRFLIEARKNYAAMGLSKSAVVDQGYEVLLLTWLGDPANEAIACLLNYLGMRAQVAGPGVEVLKSGVTTEEIVDRILDAALDELPDLHSMLEGAKNLERQKWDWALPKSLLLKSYSSLYLEFEEASEWLRQFEADSS
ncbi:DEAD/DEAH box helicase [Duganella sp. P38]|uniref:DEAD/DEAH box helicase n=1 Tax=Duganella sp. P38 TaxID=3423949 RepID=UPI003D79C8A9